MKKTKKQKQESFWQAPPKQKGGDFQKGRRKTCRPIATNRPLLVTFKSERARGTWNLLRRERDVKEKVYAAAKRFNVKVRRYANVGNHLHVVVQGRRRWQIQNFLRVLPQLVMFLVTGARKGKPVGRFWTSLAWSRIVEWGRDWRGVCRYIDKNLWEAAGVPRDVVNAFYSGSSKPK